MLKFKKKLVCFLVFFFMVGSLFLIMPISKAEGGLFSSFLGLFSGIFGNSGGGARNETYNYENNLYYDIVNRILQNIYTFQSGSNPNFGVVNNYYGDSGSNNQQSNIPDAGLQGDFAFKLKSIDVTTANYDVTNINYKNGDGFVSRPGSAYFDLYSSEVGESVSFTEKVNEDDVVGDRDDDGELIEGSSNDNCVVVAVPQALKANPVFRDNTDFNINDRLCQLIITLEDGSIIKRFFVEYFSGRESCSIESMKPANSTCKPVYSRTATEDWYPVDFNEKHRAMLPLFSFYDAVSNTTKCAGSLNDGVGNEFLGRSLNSQFRDVTFPYDFIYNSLSAYSENGFFKNRLYDANIAVGSTGRKAVITVGSSDFQYFFVNQPQKGYIGKLSILDCANKAVPLSFRSEYPRNGPKVKGAILFTSAPFLITPAISDNAGQGIGGVAFTLPTIGTPIHSDENIICTVVENKRAVIFNNLLALFSSKVNPNEVYNLNIFRFTYNRNNALGVNRDVCVFSHSDPTNQEKQITYVAKAGAIRSQRYPSYISSYVCKEDRDLIYEGLLEDIVEKVLFVYKDDDGNGKPNKCDMGYDGVSKMAQSVSTKIPVYDFINDVLTLLGYDYDGDGEVDIFDFLGSPLSPAQEAKPATENNPVPEPPKPEIYIPSHDSECLITRSTDGLGYDCNGDGVIDYDLSGGLLPGGECADLDTSAICDYFLNDGLSLPPSQRGGGSSDVSREGTPEDRAKRSTWCEYASKSTEAEKIESDYYEICFRSDGVDQVDADICKRNPRACNALDDIRDSIGNLGRGGDGDGAGESGTGTSGVDFEEDFICAPDDDKEGREEDPDCISEEEVTEQDELADYFDQLYKEDCFNDAGDSVDCSLSDLGDKMAESMAKGLVTGTVGDHSPGAGDKFLGRISAASAGQRVGSCSLYGYASIVRNSGVARDSDDDISLLDKYYSAAWHGAFNALHQINDANAIRRLVEFVCPSNPNLNQICWDFSSVMPFRDSRLLNIESRNIDLCLWRSEDQQTVGTSSWAVIFIGKIFYFVSWILGFIFLIRELF